MSPCGEGGGLSAAAIDKRMRLRSAAVGCALTNCLGNDYRTTGRIEVRAAGAPRAFDADLPAEELKRRVAAVTRPLIKQVLDLVGCRWIESLQAQRPELTRHETSVVAALLDGDCEAAVVNCLDPVTVLGSPLQLQAPRGRPRVLKVFACVELPRLRFSGQVDVLGRWLPTEQALQVTDA